MHANALLYTSNMKHRRKQLLLIVTALTLIGALFFLKSGSKQFITGYQDADAYVVCQAS